MTKLLKLAGMILSIMITGNSLGQETLKLSKVFIGLDGGLGFLSNTLKSEPTSVTSNSFLVRNSTLNGKSGGIISNASFILGYRINNEMSIDFRFGIGSFGSSTDNEFRSSETYSNIGTYIESDKFLVSYTNLRYEMSFKHKIVQLRTRKKLRFVNARFGLGMITNKGESGISYEEHYWPYLGITRDNDDSPVAYRGTKLLKISNFPFAKLGVDYESRGASGFTFAFDVFMYQPNLFSENSVVVKENQNSNSATKIYLNDRLFAYSISIGFFVNRLFVKKD
jgi:hypothetical protein